MPQVSKPAAKANMPVLVMNPDWQEGFNFFTGRWMESTHADAYHNAKRVRDCLKSQGHVVGVFSAELTEWDRVAREMLPTPYWRVFYHHPTESGYYAWFDPGTKDAWAAPFDPKMATWLEFVETKK